MRVKLFVSKVYVECLNAWDKHHVGRRRCWKETKLQTGEHLRWSILRLRLVINMLLHSLDYVLWKKSDPNLIAKWFFPEEFKYLVWAHTIGCSVQPTGCSLICAFCTWMEKPRMAADYFWGGLFLLNSTWHNALPDFKKTQLQLKQQMPGTGNRVFYTIPSMRIITDGINMFVATVRSPNGFGFLHFESG